MTTLQEIKTDILNCISVLEYDKFKDGSLKDLQYLIKLVAQDVRDLNENVISLDDRVTLLE